jgi:hypothetical protein
MYLTHILVATGLGVLTAFIRYRKNNGQLIKVIRRDGGVYYLSTLGERSSYCYAKGYYTDSAPFHSS